MTLPNTYPISVHQIEDEFGLARGSTWPTAFYGKGGAPSSGNLSLSDFFGRSNVTFTPGGAAYTAEGQFSASFSINCNVNAVWTWSRTGSASGTASLASGGTATGITFSISTTGSVSRSSTFTVTGTANGVSQSYTITVTAYGTGG